MLQARIKDLYHKLEGDRVIWMIVFFLGLLSILAVYSAMTTLAVKHGGYGTFLKHLLMLGGGFGIMYFVHKRNFKYFSKLSILLVYTSIILLIMTMLFGSNLNSAERWLKIPGIGLTFQTSDFAKIALVMFVARWLNLKRNDLDDFKGTIVPLLIYIGVVCGLILPSNFSTAAMLGFVCLVMMFLGGVPVRHLFKIIAMGVGLIILIIAVGELAPKGTLQRYETWKNRILNKVDADSEGNYQINLAKYAIHEGGVIPKGPGTSTSRNFLPHPYSDMVYAFIIEEYGSLIGGAGLLLLYLILFLRTAKFTSKCPKHFGRLTALGLSFMLVIQAFINMGVAVSLFPTTGQPLPLVSLGGTSTVFTCITVGIILSISRSVYNPEAFQEKEIADDIVEEEIDPVTKNQYQSI
ncbi:MAG: FtsW/RodA/SpoVE family cell cycle protein [Flavobacteriales bacterium]